MVKVKDVQVVGCINVTEDIVEWASSGRSGQVPQNALQALDVVLNEAVNLDPNIYNIGRSYFHMDGTTMDLGFGKEVWAVRQGMSVNHILNYGNLNPLVILEVHIRKSNSLSLLCRIVCKCI